MRRTIISGAVSLPRILAIRAERAAAVSVSTMLAL